MDNNNTKTREFSIDFNDEANLFQACEALAAALIFNCFPKKVLKKMFDDGDRLQNLQSEIIDNCMTLAYILRCYPRLPESEKEDTRKRFYDLMYIYKDNTTMWINICEKNKINWKDNKAHS